MTKIVKVVEDRGETVLAEVSLVSASRFPELERWNVPKSVIKSNGEIEEWWAKLQGGPL